MARSAIGTNDFRAPAADFGYTRSTETYSGSLDVDIWKPDTPNRPALIILHGGGWDSSDKGDLVYVRLSTLFAERGFAVFNANYTLVGADGYTSQTPIDDVLDLVQWVRDNAGDYNADATRIAVLGISAGGQLALMAAITGTDGTTRPDACIGWSPGTDLPSLVGLNAETATEAYIGAAYDGNEEDWEAKSPALIVTSACCPLRIVGSDDEETVTEEFLPVEQYDDMHTAALAAGVDSTKVIKTGSLHGIFDGNDYSGSLGASTDSNDIPGSCAWLERTLGSITPASGRTAASSRTASSGRVAA